MEAGGMVGNFMGPAMDAIRKKMKSLKDETDQLYAIIQKFEDQTKESNRVADQVPHFSKSLKKSSGALFA